MLEIWHLSFLQVVYMCDAPRVRCRIPRLYQPVVDTTVVTCWKHTGTPSQICSDGIDYFQSRSAIPQPNEMSHRNLTLPCKSNSFASRWKMRRESFNNRRKESHEIRGLITFGTELLLSALHI